MTKSRHKKDPIITADEPRGDPIARRYKQVDLNVDLKGQIRQVKAQELSIEIKKYMERLLTLVVVIKSDHTPSADKVAAYATLKTLCDDWIKLQNRSEKAGNYQANVECYRMAKKIIASKNNVEFQLVEDLYATLIKDKQLSSDVVTRTNKIIDQVTSDLEKLQPAVTTPNITAKKSTIENNDQLLFKPRSRTISNTNKVSTLPIQEQNFQFNQLQIVLAEIQNSFFRSIALHGIYDTNSKSHRDRLTIFKQLAECLEATNDPNSNYSTILNGVKNVYNAAKNMHDKKKTTLFAKVLDTQSGPLSNLIKALETQFPELQKLEEDHTHSEVRNKKLG